MNKHELKEWVSQELELRIPESVSHNEMDVLDKTSYIKMY